MAGPVRVHGGIFTNQVLAGSLRYFKMSSGATGAFANTIGQGTVEVPTVIVPGAQTTGGNPSSTTQFYVGAGMPVPNSAAERAVRALLEKATLVQAAIIDDNNIHLAFENTSFGWADDAEMEAAVQALGVIGAGAVDSSDPPVPDTTNTGTTVDLSAVTITEATFELV
jgi:hypothetical protein